MHQEKKNKRKMTMMNILRLTLISSHKIWSCGWSRD